MSFKTSWPRALSAFQRVALWTVEGFTEGIAMHSFSAFATLSDEYAHPSTAAPSPRIHMGGSAQVSSFPRSVSFTSLKNKQSKKQTQHHKQRRWTDNEQGFLRCARHLSKYLTKFGGLSMYKRSIPARHGGTLPGVPVCRKLRQEDCKFKITTKGRLTA